ncbi:MAG: hypothetical protein HY883_01205 [Deltaproteobacteria bacterium]|nr:hypothetical protein [Deltaproteobacteria bacterium]
MRKSARLIIILCFAAVFAVTLCAHGGEEPAVKIFQINYMDAEEAAAMARNLLSPEGRIAVNRGTNIIMVKDFPPNIVQIENLLKETDVRTAQVRVKVGYADGKSLRASGIDIKWNYKGSHWLVGNFVKTQSPGGVNVEAKAEVKEEKIKRRGEQSLLVLSGKEGSISAGTSIPYVDWFYAYSRNNGYYASQLRFKDVNTGFAVLPLVKGNTITVTITPEVSYITDAGRGTIRFNRISTTVDVKDGEPVVLGGSPADRESTVTRFLGGAGKTDEETDFYMVLTATVEK